MRQAVPPPLYLEIYRSRILATFIHLLHPLLILLLMLCGLNTEMLFASSIIVFMSWGLSWYDHIRPLEFAHSSSLNIMPSGIWTLTKGAGDSSELKLKEYLAVSSLLIVCFYRTKTGPSSLILLPDSASTDALRQLRVKLKETREEHQRSRLGR